VCKGTDTCWPAEERRRNSDQIQRKSKGRRDRTEEGEEGKKEWPCSQAYPVFQFSVCIDTEMHIVNANLRVKQARPWRERACNNFRMRWEWG